MKIKPYAIMLALILVSLIGCSKDDKKSRHQKTVSDQSKVTTDSDEAEQSKEEMALLEQKLAEQRVRFNLIKNKDGSYEGLTSLPAEWTTFTPLSKDELSKIKTAADDCETFVAKMATYLRRHGDGDAGAKMLKGSLDAARKTRDFLVARPKLSEYFEARRVIQTRGLNFGISYTQTDSGYLGRKLMQLSPKAAIFTTANSLSKEERATAGATAADIEEFSKIADSMLKVKIFKDKTLWSKQPTFSRRINDERHLANQSSNLFRLRQSDLVEKFNESIDDLNARGVDAETNTLSESMLDSFTKRQLLNESSWTQITDLLKAIDVAQEDAAAITSQVSAQDLIAADLINRISNQSDYLSAAEQILNYRQYYYRILEIEADLQALGVTIKSDCDEICINAVIQTENEKQVSTLVSEYQEVVAAIEVAAIQPAVAILLDRDLPAIKSDADISSVEYAVACQQTKLWLEDLRRRLNGLELM